MFRTRVRRALLAGCATFLLTGGFAAAADFTPGSSGLGDPFFPNAGNGGYDVANYASSSHTTRVRTSSTATP